MPLFTYHQNPTQLHINTTPHHAYIKTSLSEALDQTDLAVGFRRIEVKDCILLLNNHPIKFRGVNCHDSDPLTGYVISRENESYIDKHYASRLGLYQTTSAQNHQDYVKPQ